MKNPVGPEDAERFDAYVRAWTVRLNLADWRIERGIKPAKGAMASVEFNDAARLATYRLGMSHLLIAAIGVAYVWIGVEQWAKGNLGVGIMFIGYALAQAGVYLQAK